MTAALARSPWRTTALAWTSRAALPDCEDRIVQAIEAQYNYGSAQVGSGRWQFARVERPRWMTVLGYATLPLLGVGVLLLSYRRTTTFELVLSSRHDGTTVTMTGYVPGALASTIERLAYAPFATPTEPPADLPPPPTPSPEEPVPSLQPPPPPVLEPATTWHVSFDTGEAVDVEGVVIVGREPTVTEGRVSVTIDDPDRSVSAMHFSLSLDPDGPVLRDLGSTNGTAIVRDRELLAVPQDSGVPLRHGDVIAFGARRATVTLREQETW